MSCKIRPIPPGLVAIWKKCEKIVTLRTRPRLDVVVSSVFKAATIAKRSSYIDGEEKVEATRVTTLQFQPPLFVQGVWLEGD